MKADQLLNRARTIGTPLTEGEQVTFVWQGTEAQIVGDFSHWGMDRPNLILEQIKQHIWAQTIELPHDAYLEYGIIHDGLRQPDPLNPHQIADGMGHINSFFWMPGAVDTPLARPQRNVARGVVTRHQVAGEGFVVGAKRTVNLYRPPVEQPVPLLVVFDGSGYLQKAGIATIVDNLIAQRRIRPLAMALVDPGGVGRAVEYACSDTTTAFIVHCVLPFARQQLNLLDTATMPGAFGIMGASMGGLQSLYIAHRAPEIFGRVLSESGAFGADFLYYRSVLEDLIRYAPRPEIKIWMDVGLHEWFITPNRAMYSLLQSHGYDVTYLEHTSGHNYPSWRNVLWRGLEHLYPL